VHAALARQSGPVLISLSITAVCLFGSAGRLNWPNGWVLVGLSSVTGLAATVVVWRDPELVAERRNIKAGKSWDKLMVGFVVLLGPAATWIMAGLDARHRWSTGMPTPAFAAGVAAAALGGALLVWAMRSNTFFSSVVRIQRDRGQTVVASGPYRLVRHPGYAGMFVFTLATPLILNSWWAFVPAAATAMVTALRTALEDRTLQNELEGYAAYARTVRYRLMPFVW
jgi:protein-S-isoprenylcysteine O-methyltransferase Ste14